MRLEISEQGDWAHEHTHDVNWPLRKVLECDRRERKKKDIVSNNSKNKDNGRLKKNRKIKTEE